jgi:hypothetical protein
VANDASGDAFLSSSVIVRLLLENGNLCPPLPMCGGFFLRNGFKIPDQVSRFIERGDGVLKPFLI